MSHLDLSSLVRTCAVLGVLFHAFIVKTEFELYMFHFLAIYLSASIGLASALVVSAGQSFSNAAIQVFLASASFNSGVFMSMFVYRLLLHRCREFPGPFGAKFTRFYATYLNTKEYRFYKELGKLHAQYGDFVRTGPREISILDKKAIHLIYGPNTECRKASWYGQGGNDSKKVSINMTRNRKQYRQRRRAWDRGFSVKALSSYQPRIKSKVDALVDRLRQANSEPVDITKWSTLFSFDVMGEVGFGKDFNCMAMGEEHPALKSIGDHMTILGSLQTVPWLMNLLGSIPGAAAGFSEFFGICEQQISEKERIWDNEIEPQDVTSWLLKAIKDNDPSASPTREALNDDTRVVIIAGSDTTANTLANILFYLSKNALVQRKLQNLLDAALSAESSSITHYDRIKTVTLLDDIIHETLRLKPPVIQGGPRETPPQGIKVGNMYIPGNVNVSVPYFHIHRDPRYWKEATEFIPERWGERRVEMGTDDAPFLAFTQGVHSCIGKNLAFLTLRMAVAAIVREFDVTLVEGEDGSAFDDFSDTFLMKLSELHLQFKARRGF